MNAAKRLPILCHVTAEKSICFTAKGVAMLVLACVFVGMCHGDIYVIEVNQAIGPEPALISGTWDFPPDPVGELVLLNSVEIEIQHERAADIAFWISGTGFSYYDFVNNQGGDANVDGTYRFVGGGGAPAGSWANGPGTYNANAWPPYADAGFEDWSWFIEDLKPGNGGFVARITIDYNGGIIPEPNGLVIHLATISIALMTNRRHCILRAFEEAGSNNRGR